MESYQKRCARSKNPVQKKLGQIIEAKQSNLCLSADVKDKTELLKLADALGPELCMLKTHIDIITDFNGAEELMHFCQELTALAEKHQFIVFEDRKFMDIGNTVASQYGGGFYRIADWAEVVNAVILSGPGIIKGLAEVGQPKNRALLILAEMSPAGNLATGDYTRRALEYAELAPDFVIGFISNGMPRHKHYLNCFPGVKLGGGSDKLGQSYTTPEQAIVEKNGDIIIVGRGIIHAEQPVATAQAYRKCAWEGYLSCL